MKILLLLLLVPILGMAQPSRLDSLKKALKTARTDSVRFNSLMDLGWEYSETNRDTAFYFHDQAFRLAKKNARMLEQAWALWGKGYELTQLGKFPEALVCFQEGLQLAEDPANEKNCWYGQFGLANVTPHATRIAAIANLHHNLGHLMGATGNIDAQITHYRIVKALAAGIGLNWLLGEDNATLGNVYLQLNQLDSALMFEQNAERIMTVPGTYRKYLGYVYGTIGQVYLKKQNTALAIKYFHKAISVHLDQKNFAGVAGGYFDLTDYYLGKKQKDSSLYYAAKELDVLRSMKSKDLDQAYEQLYQSYKLAGKTDSAYKYQGLALSAKDSVFKATTKSLTDFQKLSFNAQIHAQELEKEKAAIQTKIRTYVLLTGIGVLLLLAGIFYRNNRQKQKANVLLSRQKDEIEAQARESQIEAALEKVRSRSLAMHKSDELQEVVAAVFDKLQELKLPFDAAAIVERVEGSNDTIHWVANEQKTYSGRLFVPDSDVMFMSDGWNAIQNGKDFFAKVYSFEEKNEGWKRIFENSDYKYIPEHRKAFILQSRFYGVSAAIAKHSIITLASYTGQVLTEPEVDVLKRMARVFEQAYVRFLDLQKAEEQARESQIETALERVRSRTMAMQKSEELAEVIQVIYEQFVNLGMDITDAGFTIDYKESDDWHLWHANAAHSFPSLLHIPYFDHPQWNRSNEAKRKGLDFFANTLTFEEKNSFFEQVFEYAPPVSKEVKELVYSAPGYIMSNVNLKHVSLYIDRFSTVPFSDADNAILKRFAAVFEQTYTRFKDLEQAEEQARESQIQLALERVRARTMAMRKSEELKEVIQVVFDQLYQLNFNIDSASFDLNFSESDDMNLWIAVHDSEYATQIYVPFFDHPLFNAYNKNKVNGQGLYTPTASYEEKNSFYECFFEYTPGISEDRKQLVFNGAGYANTFVYMKNIILSVANYAGIPYSDSDNEVIKRFAAVFEQTYTRFNDLKQAEEQAREAKIEAALERVRSRTMAMQKSEELAEVIQLTFDQFVVLNFNINAANFDNDIGSAYDKNIWLASSNRSYPARVFIPYFDHPVFNIAIEAGKNGSDHVICNLTADETKQFWGHFFKNASPLPECPPEIHDRIYNSPGYYSYTAIMKTVSLTIVNYSGYAYSESEEAVIMRFGKVFAQTYTRFKDLEQAEEQAREAKIEAALERVRGKAMAMYNSADLTSTASMVFTELRKLGINPIRCGVGMINNQSRKAALYSATSSIDGDSLGLVGWVMLEGHPVLDKIYGALVNNEEYYPVLKGKQLKAYYGKLLSGISLPTLPDFHPGEEHFGHFFPFPDGSLYAWSERRYDETEIRILRRFASVIDLTFRRYNELQRSETSAREAVRAASLDRVRAEIASMRSTYDLDKITPLIWNELTILGIAFIRCGVFIVDEPAELIHTHLSTFDGKALATFDLPFDSEGIGQNVMTAWRNKEIATIHWTKEVFAAFTTNLVEQGSVRSQDRYVTEHPDTSLDLHFFPFLQGMLYVGNATPLTNSEKELVQSLAEAFSTAYARYEDFNKLEAAKQQVDKTLTELKAAQTQLIQTEKMASLGELTAGIAHEIQNPLNFVNNFSEVNAELLEELKAESGKLKAERDEALEIDLINDVIENSKKINMHGKRADGIVKGMLQHSQSGSGKKEPTNINALADEYMRLSYHGLRAKDKNFNAEMVTHFDEKLPSVNVIPQDIGRVMLNLFNNAFYAVNQRHKTAGEGYKAEVSVSTAVESGQVIIKVKDNGIGIPEAIKEKIMQPFFTTKPTGEGTGLGLSLTYDMVVKGHGGNVTVDTIEGEGSGFTIYLPIV